MPRSQPRLSEGPDSFNGGLQCLSHHAGVRTGITDWCCCCDPCRYNRPLFRDNPCRCVPKLICFVFRADDGQRDCCKEFSTSVFATTQSIYSTIYLARFGDLDLALSIETDLDTGTLLGRGSPYGIPAFWRFKSSSLGLDEIYRIDHTNTTCLAPPSIAIEGVTIVTPDGNSCVGTITFNSYRAAKIPFKKLELIPSEDAIIPIDPYPPYVKCNCEKASKMLCVYGQRKRNVPLDGVLFVWDEALNDRWSYMPECGDPRIDQEHIYLRSDANGNCYLELDFEQTGDTTNDWADPPNTFDGYQPNDIRPGMLPIDSCTCGLRVRAESTMGRHVVITAGQCQRYDYQYCGKCRCVPEVLCVIGSIDGVHVQGKMTWNGEEWVGSGTPSAIPLTLSLTKGNCPEPLGNLTDSSVCLMQANGTMAVPLNKSEMVECGPQLSFSMRSSYDPAYPFFQNWLNGWANRCGTDCGESVCGPCITERCGGPPKVLYADLEAIRTTITFPYNDPGNPVTTITNCNLSVTLNYYQRWVSATLMCGYIGSAPLPSGGTFILEWAYSSAELFKMTRIEASGQTSEDVSFSFLPYRQCTPFLMESDWKDQSRVPWVYCAWGPYDPFSVGPIRYRVTLTE
jgi:hypothetical protein